VLASQEVSHQHSPEDKEKNLKYSVRTDGKPADKVFKGFQANGRGKRSNSLIPAKLLALSHIHYIR
jgi:hypothetical protein